MTETSAIIIRPAEQKEEDLVHLFSIVRPSLDGEEYEHKFFVKKNVSPAQTLKAMKLYREQGPEAAEMYSLEVVLGKEGYDALIECEDVSWDQMKLITEYAASVIGGKGKGPAGNQNPASKKGSRK